VEIFYIFWQLFILSSPKYCWCNFSSSLGAILS